MTTTNTLYQQLTQTLVKINDIDMANTVLGWDKEVYLPAKGAARRTQQQSTLAGIAHEMFTDPKVGDLLEQLHARRDELDARQQCNVKYAREAYQNRTRFDKTFVERQTKLVSETYHAWVAARKANDFKHQYADALGKLVELKREEAEIRGYEEHPYDALMDIFEPGAKVSELDVLFKDVREQLVDFVGQIRKQPQVENVFLHKHYDKDKQWKYGLEVLKNMGYDFDAGRQDISHHPFTTNFSSQDVRVTTRVDERNFGSMTWSCIHEGGHALYEQGLPDADYGLPTGQFVSLGIHESQSRLWENNVGRSLPYWKANYGALQSLFSENLSGVSVHDFYQGINKIEPSLIRVESDELHYHFHVAIRYEIEKRLLDGSLQAADLADCWNAMYKEYLGLDVPNDNTGVLQDIHWAHGSLGYFATYSLGSFYAAQFFAQAEKAIPNLIQQIESGDTSALLAWLREHVHQHGKLYTAQELCERITGEPLNFKYFMEYARTKYGAIYRL
ncbi:MAG: carboxypeptidase M32 [Saprospiraceae bacterium]